MEVIDVIILGGLGIGAAQGAWTGVIRQVFGLAGTILALLLATELMMPVGDQLGAYFSLSDELAPIGGFLLVFGIVQVIAFITARVLERLVKVLRLSLVNRAAGAVLGGVKAVLIASALLMALGLFGVPDREVQRSSIFYEPVAEVVPAAWSRFERHWPAVRSWYERVQDYTREAVDSQT